MDECSFFCNTIYKDNCTFYIQDNKQRICEIWTMDFGTYEQGCTKHEGPKSPLWDPQVDSPTGCEGDKCKVCSDPDKYHLYPLLTMLYSISGIQTELLYVWGRPAGTSEFNSWRKDLPASMCPCAKLQVLHLGPKWLWLSAFGFIESAVWSGQS